VELHGRIRGGVIVLSPQMVALRDNFARRLKDDTPIRIVLTRIGRAKTAQQVKCHWGLVLGMIREQFRERGMDLATFLGSSLIPEGIEVPTDVIQAVLYACCNDVGDNGERKTLSRMDTVEASRFFEKCRIHAASAWDIQIPDPDPAWCRTEKL
jgi:hypothetical protein